MSAAASPPSPKSATAGRMAGVVIFLVVAACIALIGLAGYVKYQLDRSQNALASQEQPLSPEQQAFDKIRRDLGYGGFLGSAQSFAASHDANLMNDMKNHIKQADDSFEKLPQKAAADVRHDLQAILATFDAAMQKAEKSTNGEFTSADLAPLYAALPVLDTRVASAVSANRQSEQNRAQFWSMVLTIICWASLIIAAALTAGIYLVLRDRNSAPMRALAQSVKNMARGDMRTSIWGMERQDAIGELARSVDMARFHFSQLPDMSLLSEQGPVRIRFEGNTRSLFEAMMRVISHDSEQVHQQAALLTSGVTKQQETLAHVIERVEAVLQNVEKRAVSGDQQVRQALQNMLSSAESLKNAQEHASDQLNRIIPFLQERSQGLSEIAQITGKQVSQALQALSQTERGLRANAEQGEEAIRKFSSTADTLGERLFGAVNLLQASGKVLSETTDTMTSKFDQAIAHIGHAPTSAIAAGGGVDNETTDRLEAATSSLVTLQGKLENIIAKQTQTTTAHIELLMAQSKGLLSQASTSSQTLSAASDRLRDEQSKMGDLQSKISAMLGDPRAVAPAASTQSVEEIAAPLLNDVREAFTSIEQRLSLLQNQVGTLLATSQVAAPTKSSEDVNEQMREHWFQMAGQIEASRSNLAQIIAQQTDRIEAHFMQQPVAAVGGGDYSRETQSQLEQQTNILHELVTTLSLLDAHMQELRNQVTASRRAS